VSGKQRPRKRRLNGGPDVRSFDLGLTVPRCYLFYENSTYCRLQAMRDLAG
jgi:hypothetical protein